MPTDIAPPPVAATSITPDTTGPAINRIADRLKGDVAARFAALMAEGEGTPATLPVAALTTPPSATPPAAPAPAAPTPPPDPFEDPTIPTHERPPASAARATKEDWMRFRSLMKGQVEAERTALAAARQELEALRARTATPDAATEAWKRERADLESRLERADLANAPRFRNHYDGGIAKAIKLAVSAAGPHGAEVERLLKAPTPETDKRLQEIVTELGFRGRAIGNAADTIAALTLERDEQLANAATNLRLLRDHEAQEAATTTARTAAQRTTLADTLVARARALPEFSPASTDPVHTTFATEALEFIRAASLGRLSQEDTALLPVAAMKAHYLEQIRVPALESELATLRARLASLTAAGPRVEGGGTGPTPTPPGRTTLTAATYDPMKAVAEVTERFNREMGR